MSEKKKSIFERALDMDDEVKWWMRQTKQELISEFVESWDNLRDFVLEAPILSNDVYIFRDYIHKIKDYIKLERKKWEERSK